jgi:hypothetical protein
MSDAFDDFRKDLLGLPDTGTGGIVDALRWTHAGSLANGTFTTDAAAIADTTTITFSTLVKNGTAVVISAATFSGRAEYFFLTDNASGKTSSFHIDAVVDVTDGVQFSVSSGTREAVDWTGDHSLTLLVPSLSLGAVLTSADITPVADGACTSTIYLPSEGLTLTISIPTTNGVITGPPSLSLA